MSITSIQRDQNNNVSLVRIITTDTLSTVASYNYILNEYDTILSLNGGVWSWFTSDMILVSASDGNAFFQFTDSTFSTLIIYGEQGSGVINPGLANEIAFYPSNGTNISGITGNNNSVLITSNSGVPSMSQILPATIQANITTLGTIVNGTWQATLIDVPYGGTNADSFTPYSIICGGTTSTGSLQSVSVSGATDGYILTYTGVSSLPTWQANAASGTINSGTVNSLPYYSTSPSGTTLSAMSIVDNAVLATSGLGVPSLVTTLPNMNIGTPTAGNLENCTGYPVSSIANDTILSNISGATAAPSANTLSAILDAVISSTANTMLVRGSSTWTALSSANSSVLVTNGSGVQSFSTTLPSGISATNMKLTTPYITTALYDTNGADWITQTATASAVNYINVTNNATGDAPIIAAKGSDTNIILQLKGQGTSGVAVQGYSTNTAAAAGYVGEVISSSVIQSSAVSVSNNTIFDLTSISCTAGSWMIFGNMAYSASGNNMFNVVGWITLTSATAPDYSLQTYIYDTTAFLTNGAIVVPGRILRFTTTTTVYISGQAAFNTGTVSCSGNIFAVRIC